MKQVVIGWTLVITLLLVCGVGDAALGESLDTRVTMLVGHPGSGSDSGSVMVVPGTVIPFLEGPRPVLAPTDESEARAEELQALSDKLRRAVGLDTVEVAYSEAYPLEVDKPRTVTGPRSTSEIKGDLTLLDFNAKLAVYRVVLRQGSETLADSKVAVARGGRAVVGGLDGEEAPYFFLVLQPDSDTLFVVGDVVAPRKIYAEPPTYTEEARKNGIQGIVVVRTVINDQGLVENVEVLKDLPYGLTEQAVEAIKKWKFEPATFEGEPVAVYYNLTVRFRLNGDKKKDEGS